MPSRTFVKPKERRDVKGKVGAVIGTYNTSQGGAPPYGHAALALSLAILRAHNPDCPILVVDDCSGNNEQLAEIASASGAEAVTNVNKMGHTSGDFSVFGRGLEWARNLGLEYLCKLSHRFIVDVPNWLTIESQKLEDSGYGTATREFEHSGNPGVRTECVLMNVTRWSTLPIRTAMRAGRSLSGWWCEGEIRRLASEYVDSGRVPGWLHWDMMSERGKDTPPVYFRDMDGDPHTHFHKLAHKHGLSLPWYFSTADSVLSDEYAP